MSKKCSMVNWLFTIVGTCIVNSENKNINTRSSNFCDILTKSGVLSSRNIKSAILKKYMYRVVVATFIS